MDIAGWLLALFAVAAGANQLFRLVDRLKEKPPPSQTYQPKGDYALRIELKQFVSRPEFEAMKKDMGHQLENLQQNVTEMRREQRTDRNEIVRAIDEKAVALHKRVDKTLEAVSRIEGRLERQ